MTRGPVLLISNIAVTCSEDELAQWLENQGCDVDAVVVIRDVVSGTSPSFAHVHLRDPQSIRDAARMLDGQILHGRTVRATGLLSRPRTVVPHTAKYSSEGAPSV